MRNLDVNIEFRKQKILKVHAVAALSQSSGENEVVFKSCSVLMSSPAVSSSSPV